MRQTRLQPKTLRPFEQREGAATRKVKFVSKPVPPAVAGESSFKTREILKTPIGMEVTLTRVEPVVEQAA